MSNIDPGGNSGVPPDLSNIQANFGQQQAKISALKELVRQSEVAQGHKTANAQEKVKNIAQRLTNLKSKAFRSKKGGTEKPINQIKEEIDESHHYDDSFASGSQSSIVKAKSETPGSEKIQLLRKQMEENRQKIAEREHNKRDIEELVTQLKAKFDYNQMAIDKSSQLGKSVGDLSVLPPVTITKEKFQSASDLTGFSSHLDKERIKYLEKRLREMEIDIKNKENEFFNKDPESEHLKVIKQLEGKILDFEENIKEKECVIEARTQAVNLLSENMSMKGKNTIDLLEDTKQEMFAMQQTFIETEEKYKQEIADLKEELDEKCLKISELNDVNDILESSRFDLTCSTSTLKTQINELEAECLKLNELNIVQQKKIDELDNGNNAIESDSNVYHESVDDLHDKIHLLEKSLEEHRQECIKHIETIEKYENEMMEKTVEYDVLNANFLVLQEKIKSMTPKPLFSLTTDPTSASSAEIQRLQHELDQALENASISQFKIIQLEKLIDESTKTHPRKISPTTLSAEDAARVTNDLQTIEMEDKIESHIKTIEELRNQIMKLNAEKNELNRKLNNYIAENIELLDKLEKLSKGSSAESIEIVENLTQQEKLEMAQFKFTTDATNKHSMDIDDIDKEAMSQDLSESLVKLREDSSMLMHKIEMFTNERREVLDKMDDLNAENAAYVQQITELSTIKDNLNKENLLLKNDKIKLQKKLQKIETEKLELTQSVKELSINRLTLQDDINDMIKEKNAAEEINRDSYVKGLTSLDNELENYRKGKDKNIKFTISKKLAKEAKNVHTLMTQLMVDFDKNVEQMVSLECELKAIKQVQQETIQNLMDTQQTDDFVLPDDDELDECREELERMIVKEGSQQGQIISSTHSNESHSDDQPIASTDKEYTENLISIEIHEQELHKLRHDFENRLDACYKEIDILKSLAAEQKQQLITTFMEHETEIEDKLNQCSEYEEKIKNLTHELDVTKNQMSSSHDKYVAELQNKIETLKGIFDENNDLLEHQASELHNKQDTIDTLNGQIMNLYGTMEENSNKVLTMDDEIAQLNELLDTNQSENDKLQRLNIEHLQTIENLTKLNDDKTRELFELNNNLKITKTQLDETINSLRETIDKKSNEILELKKHAIVDDVSSKLQESIRQLNDTVNDLETKNKEQLDKLKKFAANLKKKNAQCLSLEEELAQLRKLSTSTMIDNNEADDLKIMLQQKTQQILDNQQLLNNNEAELNRLKREITSNELLQKQVVDDNSDISRLTDENIKLKNTVEKIVNENGQYQKEIQFLRNKSDEFDSYQEQTIDNISSLRTHLNDKQQSIIELNDKINQIENKLIEIQNEKQEIFNTLSDERKQFENKLIQSQTSLDALSSELAQISEDLRQKNIKFEKCKAVIKEKNREIKRLQDLSNELTEKLSFSNESNINQSATSNDNFVELNALKLQLIENDNEHKNAQAATYAKIQENQLYIETIEMENAELKNKITKLEEGISFVEERRSSLERQTVNLGTELNDKTMEYKQNEDELVQRLNALSTHDEIIEQKFKEAIADKEELQTNLRDMETEKCQMLRKMSTLENQISDIQNNVLAELNSDNASLNEENSFLRMELKRQNNDFERKLTEKGNEVIDLENDLVAQMQKIENERRALQENLEKSTDENTELKYEIGSLKDSVTALDEANMDLEREMTALKLEYENLNQNHIEIQEMRMQVIHDQTEIDNLKSQNNALIQSHDIEQSTLRQQIYDLESCIARNQCEIETINARNIAMQQNNEHELTALRQQIAELDSVKTQIGQNQTDDQIFIQNENERLRTLLETKEVEIQNYQRQNLQLQMSIQSNVSATNDPFSGIARNSSSSSNNSESLLLKERITALENQLQMANNDVQRLNNSHELNQNEAELNRNFIQQLEIKLQALSNDLQTLQTNNVELSNELSARQITITNLQEFNDNLIEDNNQIKAKITEIQNECTEKDTKLTKLNEELSITLTAKAVEEPQIVKLENRNNQQAISQQNEQHQLNVANLEQYISDLQIQLRISTNDCEQFTETIRSLENEIQIGNNTINKLENELKELREKQILAETEKLIIQPVTDKKIPVAEALAFKSTGVPSFNSAMFFADTSAKPSLFDDSFVAGGNESSDGVDIGLPVVEEVIIPKKAYLCHENEEQDDEWGFGSSDAILEEQHQQSSSMTSSTTLIPPHIGFEVKLQEYEDKVQELQSECNRLREEISSQKSTSSKMLKKLKEYKSKNDYLTKNQRKSSSVESNDLDLAIQDELNTQIKTFESLVKELRTELNREQTEKQALLKRNDVLTAATDRFTEMKERQDKEIDDGRKIINELRYKLQQLEEWGDKSDSVLINEEIQNIQKQLQNERSHNLILEERIRKLQNSLLAHNDNEQDLSDVVEQNEKMSQQHEIEMQTKMQLIEKLETNVKHLNSEIEHSISTIDVLTQESNNIKLKLDQLMEEHKHKIDENEILLKQLNDLNEKNVQLANEIDRLNGGSNNMFNEYCTESNPIIQELEQKIQDLSAAVQYRDAEILHLNQKAEDALKEDQTESLVNEILGKNAEITSLKTHVKQLECDKNELSKEISSKIVAVDTNELQEKINRLECTITELSNEKNQMEHELNVLNDQVLKSLEFEDKMKQTILDIDAKNSEICELRFSLAQLQEKQESNDGFIPGSNIGDETVKKLNDEWEQEAEQRCAKVADSWRQHLAQRDEEFIAMETQFQQEIAKLQDQLANLSNVGDTSSNNDTKIESKIEQSTNSSADKKELPEIIDKQEKEIVSLKQQLAIRSAEYARIATQIDPFGQMSSSRNVMSINLNKSSNTGQSSDTTTNNKSELDLALYMLYQRDMRCEELTEELVHLLEERDTLQLKLSDSIRQIEEFKRKPGDDSNVDVLSDTGLDSSGSQSSPEQLTEKISKLHTTTDTNRMKTLIDERQYNQRQMALLQQDVATLPPEAVAKLIGTDYNNQSRQSQQQNPSSLILNWLWGKSTSDN